MSERATADVATAAPGGDPIAAWLIDEAWRLGGTAALIEALCGRFVAGGIPLWRAQLSDDDAASLALGLALPVAPRRRRRRHPGCAPFGRRIRGIPVEPDSAVVENRATLRRRLVGPKAELDFALLREIRDEGGTDYLCVPVEFSDGHVNTVSVTSDAAHGFSRDDLDRMFALLPLFARIVEVHAVQRLAADLLDVYVGHDAGLRILKGQIGRGDGQTFAPPSGPATFADLRRSPIPWPGTS